MENHALIIGAGKIGRGFIAQLLIKSGWSVSFADVSEDLISGLNESGKYVSHILGDSTKNTEITHFNAFNLQDQTSFNSAWTKSSLIFTAMGGKNLESIAPKMVNALKNSIKQQDNDIKNIITCENWKDPALKLKKFILSELSFSQNIYFNSHVGVSEAVIMRVSVNPSEEQRSAYPFDTWSQDFWDLPINRETFLGPYPDIENFLFIDNFGRFLEQKIFTNNASNATIAYNGYHKGFIYTADAAHDPIIEALLDQTIEEVNQVIHYEFGVPIVDQQLFAQKAKAKYSDKTIIDPLFRHAADPIRKLGPDDRLIAPARLAIKHGIKPEALVKTIVAAIYYDYVNDPAAVELSKIRNERGIDFILTTICKLSPDEELYKLIKEHVCIFLETRHK